MQKIILLILTLVFSVSGNASAEQLPQSGMCPDNLTLTQNLKAPEIGEKNIRNDNYHWYTKTLVKEAHILQKHLNRLGFNAGKIDGIIGPNTKGAILRMQEFLGTKKDGYVGPKTRILLNNSCGKNAEANIKISDYTEMRKDFSYKNQNYTAIRSYSQNNIEKVLAVNLETNKTSILNRDDFVFSKK